MSRTRLSIMLAVCAVLVVPSVAEARSCSYSTGKQHPQVRGLQITGGLTCTSARRVISAVRDAEDWAGAYFGDDWDYVEYPTGGYDADGFLRVRRFRCDYLLRGIGSKFVLTICRSGRVTVSAELHGR